MLSPVALAHAVLEDVERRDRHLRFSAGTTPARASREAERAGRALAAGRSRGPLDGVPYMVKDLFDVDGEPNTAGTPLLAAEPARGDAAVVRRLGDAGAVLVGRTRSGPLAATILGINHAEPTPRNPWCATAVPGGSSSGSAVAVAAGLVPFALGSDTGGSVRVPAALCGVVGFKPTFGRIDVAGMHPLAPSLDTVGVLARTVDDLVVVDGVLRGRVLDLPRDVRGLRLALAETLFLDDTDDEVSGAVDEAVRVLRQLGVQVRGVALPELEELHRLAGEASLIAVEAYPLHRRVIDHPDSDWVVHWLRRGAELSPDLAARTRRRVAELAAALDARLRGFDALLAPTTTRVAPALAACHEPEGHARMNALLSRNTRVGNLAGWCGLSVPCGRSADGLPIGLMIYGVADRDATVLALGRAYESVTQWQRVARDEDPT